MEIKQRSMLFEEMNNRLSNDELKILCFKLNIDYDNIPGRDKQTKIVELINLIERQGKYQFSWKLWLKRFHIFQYRNTYPTYLGLNVLLLFCHLLSKKDL